MGFLGFLNRFLILEFWEVIRSLVSGFYVFRIFLIGVLGFIYYDFLVFEGLFIMGLVDLGLNVVLYLLVGDYECCV